MHINLKPETTEFYHNTTQCHKPVDFEWRLQSTTYAFIKSLL